MWQRKGSPSVASPTQYLQPQLAAMCWLSHWQLRQDGREICNGKKTSAQEMIQTLKQKNLKVRVILTVMYFNIGTHFHGGPQSLNLHTCSDINLYRVTGMLWPLQRNQTNMVKDLYFKPYPSTAPYLLFFTIQDCSGLFWPLHSGPLPNRLNITAHDIGAV